MAYKENTSSGWIEVICGPMFAGKTEELIRRTTRMQYAKKQFMVFKPNIDNRYSTTEIVSHSNYKKIAIGIDKPIEILSLITPSIEAIVIDEVQFFDSSLIEVVEHLANQGLRVICAGLDTDFKGEPFGIMPELLARAEKVTKLSAICTVCGSPATKTQRIINGNPAYYDDPIVLVGANESYEARCRKCHVVLKREK